MANIDLRPIVGRSIGTTKGQAILLVCFYDPNGISTIWENIRRLQKSSRYSIEVLNLWPGREGRHLEIPSTVDLNDFLGVMIHPTAAYNPANLFSLETRLPTKFANYDGLKILAKQDEHYKSRQFSEFLRYGKFDILTTCVPPGELEKVYPPEVVGDIEILHTLTGYVSQYMREIEPIPYANRAVDIFYRGSFQPISFGELGFEKHQIGEAVACHPATQHLRLDISARWEDRISGIAWFDRLRNSRSVLGVESGSNIFDFDGEVEEKSTAFAARHSDLDPNSHEYYEKAKSEFLDKYEGNVRYAQISPRHLEAAATHSLQVLYEGDYSNIFIPHRHFFPLTKNLSNIEEAVDFIQDEKRAMAMIECAHEEIIRSEKYSYETFVDEFDAALDRAAESKGLIACKTKKSPGYSANRRPKVLVLAAHDPVIDPRIDWMASSFENTCEVWELGCYHFDKIGTCPSIVRVDENRHRVKIERTLHNWPWFEALTRGTLANTPGLREIAELELIIAAHPKKLIRTLGAYDSTQVDLSRFRELCRYFSNTNSSLYQAAVNLGKFDVIINADLETLPAAVALKHLWKSQLVFDSHEYWPFSYLTFRAWENEFWSNLEHRLAGEADIRVTVSDTLAEHLTREYGLEFRSIPNAARVSDGNHSTPVTLPNNDGTIKFLFQGNFAPGRGLDILVEAWSDAPVNALLLLRGPDNAYRQEIIAQARANGTFEKTVFFPDAVSESELICTARQANVGLIPYDPRHYGNRFACPNKLSQYMAAGLPILTNNIEYVANIVTHNRLGFVAEFHNRKALLAAIAHCMKPDQLSIIGARSRSFFENHFNWDRLSSQLVADILSNIGEVETDRAETDTAKLLADDCMSIVERTKGGWDDPDPSKHVTDPLLFHSLRTVWLFKKIWHQLPPKNRILVRQFAERLRHRLSTRR